MSALARSPVSTNSRLPSLKRARIYAQKKNSIKTHYLIESVTWEERAKESVRTRNSACAWFAVAEHTSVFVVMLSQAVGLPNMAT